MRRGIYSGALGVTLVWVIYLIYLMLAKNFYTNLDQFAGLIFGGLGYGMVILILIILFGVLFGALGGAIGSGTMIIMMEIYKKPTPETLKPKVNNSNQ